MARTLTLPDLGPDLLSILLKRHLEGQCRMAAAACCKALWRASCLPGVWEDASLCLDISVREHAYSALLFLNRRGLGLRRMRLTLLECSALSLARLAPLLEQLPALQELSLHSHYLALLSSVAYNLPRLQYLKVGDSESCKIARLPENSLPRLRQLSCLRHLAIHFYLERPGYLNFGPLLRGIEGLSSLTALVLVNGCSRAKGPLTHLGGTWSQLSRLQKLQQYSDSLGLDLPPSTGSLAELRSVQLRKFCWLSRGGALCALRGLHSLTVTCEGGEGPEPYRRIPDIPGLKQALSLLRELHWNTPAQGLLESGQFCLEHLSSLTVTTHPELFESLLWSPRCRLQCLVMDRIKLEVSHTCSLTGLSPLTSLTHLTVTFAEAPCAIEQLLPQAPCLPRLQELCLKNTGLPFLPAELSQADGLKVLRFGYSNGVPITEACVAILGALAHLVHFEPSRGVWDKQSKENVRVLQELKPDLVIKHAGMFMCPWA